MYKITALLFTLFIHCNLFSVTTTWTGSEDNSWENETNWTYGLPSEIDTAVINNKMTACILSSSTLVYHLSIEDSSSLIITESLELGNNLIIGNESSLLILGELIVNGNTLVENFSEINLIGTENPSATFVGNIDFQNVNSIFSTQGDEINVLFNGSLLNISNTSFQFNNCNCTYQSDNPQNLAPSSYGVLKLSGDGEKTISQSIVLVNDSLDLTTTQIIITEGSLQTLPETVVLTGSSTVNYNSINANQTVLNLGVPFYNLSLSGDSIKLTEAGFDHLRVLNDLNIDAPFNIENDSLSIGGDFTINEAFIQNDAVITINGSNSSEIKGNQTLDIKELIIDKEENNNTYISNEVRILPGGQLSLKKDSLFVLGSLIFQADSSGYSTLDALPGLASIIGTVKVNHFINTNRRAWHTISMPLDSIPVTDLVDDLIVTGNFFGNRNDEIGGVLEPSLFQFDTIAEQIKWKAFPENGTNELLRTKESYRIFIQDDLDKASSKTLDFTGILNQGQIDLPLSFIENNSEQDGWNLIANPYLSNLKWNEIDKTGLSFNSAYLWNPTTNDFEIIEQNSTIPPFNSFFVKANGTQNSLTLQENLKTRESITSEKTNSSNTILVGLEENNIDRIFNFTSSEIVIDENSTDFVDKNLDQGFLSRNTFNGFGQNDHVDIGSLSEEGVTLKKNFISSISGKTIQLHTELSTYNNFNINISLRDFNLSGIISLEDTYLNQVTFLDSKNEINYNFVTNNDSASVSNTRFKLNIDLIPVAVADALNNKSYVAVYPNPASYGFYFSCLPKFSSLVIKNVHGKIISTTTIENKKNGFINTENLSAGVYSVTFISSNESYTESLTLN